MFQSVSINFMINVGLDVGDQNYAVNTNDYKKF